jgi:hypothetical protein
MLRPRPIRSQIYLPVVRFGVTDADWKFVIFFTLLCYSVPFFFNMKLLRFPVEIWTTILGLVGSIAFFNFVRMGRRPFWLQHQIAALMTASRHRHALPIDQRERPWLLNNEQN